MRRAGRRAGRVADCPPGRPACQPLRAVAGALSSPRSGLHAMLDQGYVVRRPTIRSLGTPGVHPYPRRD